MCIGKVLAVFRLRQFLGHKARMWADWSPDLRLFKQSVTAPSRPCQFENLATLARRGVRSGDSSAIDGQHAPATRSSSTSENASEEAVGWARTVSLRTIQGHGLPRNCHIQ